MPDSLPETERRTLAQTAERLVRDRVQPAYRRLRDFVTGTYLGAAPTEVGVGRWPDGERLYAFCIRRNTTTNITADQAHQLGVSEVARIRAEMEAVKTRAGWKGSLADAFQQLRTDPRHFYRTGDELLLHTRALAKRIDPKLVRLFGTLPRLPYGVEPTPAAMAPDATTGFYYPGAEDGSRAGTYWVNTYKPETRPRWEMVRCSPSTRRSRATTFKSRSPPSSTTSRPSGATATTWPSARAGGSTRESLGDELGL